MEGGGTWGDHLKQLQKRRKEPLAELVPPPFPQGLGLVWEHFLELRGNCKDGIITYTDIVHFKECTQNPLSARDVDLILKLDGTYHKVMGEK